MYPEYMKFTTGSTQNESKDAVNFKEVVNAFETSFLLPDLILRVVLTDGSLINKHHLEDRI